MFVHHPRTGLNRAGDAGNILVRGTSIGISPNIITRVLSQSTSELTKICHFEITKQKKLSPPQTHPPVWRGTTAPHTLRRFIPQPWTGVDATASMRISQFVTDATTLHCCQTVCPWWWLSKTTHYGVMSIDSHAASSHGSNCNNWPTDRLYQITLRYGSQSHYRMIQSALQ